MPAESVVDALRKVHRLLRPGGVALNCRPVASGPTLEVRIWSGNTPLGPLPYSDAFIRNIQDAGAGFDLLCDEGLFAKGPHARYTVDIRFASLNEWEQYWAAEAPDYAPPNDGLLPAINELMAQPVAELVMRKPIEATRFGV